MIRFDKLYKIAKDFKTGSYINDKVGSIKIYKKSQSLELIIEAEMVPSIRKKLAEKLEADKMVYGKASIGKSSGVGLDNIIENSTVLSDKTQKLLDRLNKSNVSVTEYFHAEANALTRTPSK